LNRHENLATKFFFASTGLQYEKQMAVPALDCYLPFHCGVRLLRKASIPSRKSSLI
jgi:hypothetical protein